LIQKAIGLVKDDGLEAWCGNFAIWVRQEIVEASWSSHEQVASFTLHLIEHSLLIASTNGNLNFKCSHTGEFLGLNCDLLSQFTGRRDDDSADIRCRGTVSSALRGVCEFGAVLQDVLDNRDKESKRLAGTCSCLRNTSSCQQLSWEFSSLLRCWDTYTSVPFKVSSIVSACTSVMV